MCAHAGVLTGTIRQKTDRRQVQTDRHTDMQTYRKTDRRAEEDKRTERIVWRRAAGVHGKQRLNSTNAFDSDPKSLLAYSSYHPFQRRTDGFWETHFQTSIKGVRRGDTINRGRFW